MSTQIEPNQTPDPGDDRAKWTQFYNELRAERDQLRKEVLKMREDYHALYFGMLVTGKCESPYTMDEVLTFVAHQPSITQMIEELSSEQTR
jgi:spore coat polysaccharide biosynthesis protein SpsF (cytidylyltransferase family)